MKLTKFLIFILLTASIFALPNPTLTVGSFPLNTTTGTPTPISYGSGTGGWVDAVVGINIDQSVAFPWANGWTLEVSNDWSVTSGPVILSTFPQSVYYIIFEYQIYNIEGTLPAGLTLSHTDGETLDFGGSWDAYITATGTCTERCDNYSFDLRMNIPDANVTGDFKLAGIYKTSVTLTLTNN
ncbi:MAG: hypothetical protein PF637_04235 [Spirochaetes bacterium]|jgi:hypothetical protein|nr:hypothetical protein [Spirochaetota bacterium]